MTFTFKWDLNVLKVWLKCQFRLKFAFNKYDGATSNFHNIKEINNSYCESRLETDTSSRLYTYKLAVVVCRLSLFHGCSGFVVLWCRYCSVLCSGSMSQTQDVKFWVKHLKETFYEIKSISTKADNRLERSDIKPNDAANNSLHKETLHSSFPASSGTFHLPNVKQPT